MDIVEEIGIAAALEQLAEESCELGQSSLKLARYIRKENPIRKSEIDIKESIIEEIGDILNCLNVLGYIDITKRDINKDILDVIKYKRNRCENSIIDAKNNTK